MAEKFANCLAPPIPFHEHLPKFLADGSNLFIDPLKFFCFLTWLEGLDAKAPEKSLFCFLMGEIHGSHLLVVEVLEGEIHQETSIGEFAPGQIDFSPDVFVVDEVLAPLFLPEMGFEGNREGTAHLHCHAGRKVRTRFVVEEPHHLVVKIDRGAGELDFGQFIELLHCQRL